MTDQSREMALERAHLDSILAEVHAQIEQAETTLHIRREKVSEERRWMWETQAKSDTCDQDDWLELMFEIRETRRREQEARIASGRLLALKKLAGSPYFGRFDFREIDTELRDEVYIGIAGLTDRRTGRMMVCDWRAPIAGMFYDFEPGPAGFQADGRYIGGEMTLKRQYRIKQGRLDDMFDCAVRIGDDILQEMLARSAGRKMGTIVTTIQREQNRIIRDDRDAVLMVQGPAGSGKTSIALQRAAYLLYRFRGNLEAREIAVFSLSWLQNEYTSGVLPELGEENVSQKTFHDYAARRLCLTVSLESPFEQMEALLQSPDTHREIRMQGIRMKGSSEWAAILKNHVARLGRICVPGDDVRFDGRVVMTQDAVKLLLQQEYVFLPVAARLEKVRRRVEFLIEPDMREKRRVIEKLRAELTQDERVAELQEELRLECDRLNRSLDSWASLDVLSVYRSLLNDDRAFARASAGRELPAGESEVRRATLQALADGRVPYEDVPALVLLKNLLEGPPPPEFRHIIVDEGQEYSWMQLHALAQEFPGCGLTVLGDRRQASPGRGDEWSQLARAFDGRTIECAELRRSYRSTREIGAFTDALLLRGDRVEHVDRPGDKPVLVVAAEGGMDEAVAKGVAEVRRRGARTIAILSRTEADAQKAAQTAIGEFRPALVSDDGSPLVSDFVTLPVFLAKGLEFDAVLVLNADNYDRVFDRALFYCACTRALHHLRIFTAGGTPPILEGVDPDLYSKVG